MIQDTVPLLAFAAGAQHYVLDVMRVRELVRCMSLVPARGAHPSLLGHMVLRGEVLPVVDVCLALGKPTGPGYRAPSGSGHPPHILVVEAMGHTLGLNVDRVLEVLRLPVHELKQDTSPEALRVKHCFGLCHVRGVPHLLLDVRPLISLINPGHAQPGETDA